MIGKGKAIAHTAVAMEYGWNQDKDAAVVFKQQVLGENPKEVSNEFKIIQQMNTKCEKNTLSFVLSPVIEDGKKLSDKQLGNITKAFLKEMKLTEHQAIAFVHRDKAHIHLHLYANRIDFKGKAYADNFIGKRSQQAAEHVAKEMGLTTVKEVQLKKELGTLPIRHEIKKIHQKVMESQRPKTLDGYIQAMKAQKVKVIPSINKAKQLQGFRFEYQGHDFKGSDVHRSMSGGKLMGQLSPHLGKGKPMPAAKSIQMLGKTLELSTNLATSIAKSILKKVIKRSIDKGIGF